ncbi:IS605 family transposase OrfB [mine drainage metagenome]|uniref:IS605 family transposase OrfB n=1 Tax=mine drainage metagenome TaxID=410659 RepID=T0ZBQ2_9ZZZZ
MDTKESNAVMEFVLQGHEVMEEKQPENFSAMPKPPKYRNRNGEFILIFTNQQCSIHDGILRFPGIMGMEVKTRLADTDLRE